MKAFKIVFFIIFVSVILSVLFLTVTLLTGYEIQRDVSYGEHEHNTMDIYIPSEAYEKEICGVVLFIHGGSWSGGDKKEEEARCRIVASQGYIAASLNYTLRTAENADEYTVFQVLDEIDAALAKIKDLASKLNIEIDKAAISGYSAGAHLAMLYSFSRGNTAPLEIAFTSSMAAPADISEAVWGSDMAARIGSILTGEEITAEMVERGEAGELLSSVSPISYINENTPPTLIAHGGCDQVVPIANTESLIQKLSLNLEKNC